MLGLTATAPTSSRDERQHSYKTARMSIWASVVDTKAHSLRLQARTSSFLRACLGVFGRLATSGGPFWMSQHWNHTVSRFRWLRGFDDLPGHPDAVFIVAETGGFRGFDGGVYKYIYAKAGDPCGPVHKWWPGPKSPPKTGTFFSDVPLTAVAMTLLFLITVIFCLCVCALEEQYC